MAKSFSITNMAAFQKSLDKAMKNAKKGVEDEVLVKVAMDTHRNLQKRTPREFGRARAGWIPTVDASPSDWKPPEGQGHYSLTPFDNADSIKFNSYIDLSNNVEYIKPLNQGHSKQATNIVPFVIARMTAYLNLLSRKESNRKIK